MTQKIKLVVKLDTDKGKVFFYIGNQKVTSNVSLIYPKKKEASAQARFNHKNNNYFTDNVVWEITQ